MAEITAVFCDLGGVLLSNGWDSEQRARAVEHFGLDREEFDDRHREVVGSLETGQCTLDDYLQATVFYEPRPFTAAEFRRFMEAQSHAFEDSLGVFDDLASTGHYLRATLNNESRELNEYRIERFDLRRRFACFFTSSFLGVMKPAPRIYLIALEVTQRRPEEVLFVDDRAQNLEPARALGMHTLHYRARDGADALRRGLREHGISV
jgi:putative hydrolase of the HAD superfamily